jgi:hypothetical protein
VEPLSDDPKAEGPFETGDFYCAVVEWGLQTGATLTTLAKAEKFVTTAIDAVIDVEMSKETALRIGDIDPIVYEPEVLSFFRPADPPITSGLKLAAFGRQPPFPDPEPRFTPLSFQQASAMLCQGLACAAEHAAKRSGS